MLSLSFEALKFKLSQACLLCNFEFHYDGCDFISYVYLFILLYWGPNTHHRDYGSMNTPIDDSFSSGWSEPLLMFPEGYIIWV